MSNPKVSVIIPIKNGGDIFKKVVKSVLSQKTDFEFELVAVDSGSKDGTLEFIEDVAKSDNRVKVYQIKPSEFGHGKTRNYGISLTHSQFIAFITQDALPYNEFWLANLIKVFDDKEIAGVFGKHLPYDDCYPVEKKQIVDHFDLSFGKQFSKVKITDQKDFENRRGWYVYYSDNNSALRREVWEKIKLPNVEMAEDQRWAEMILKAGYAKAYAPDAIVSHSHRYSFKQIIKRYYDEYRFHAEVGNVTVASIKDAFNFFKSSYKYSFKTIFTGKFNIFQKIYWIIFYIFYDVVRSYGYYVGTNYKNVSEERFSMQHEIKKK